ncbi:hypothetical protein BDV32DRAFT_118928 [Aspergillus pseudonomiae]|nr:hypothetical protein BDV32DRAFT_118928 [Aspergillus pseudonomiae]
MVQSQQNGSATPEMICVAKRKTFGWPAILCPQRPLTLAIYPLQSSVALYGTVKTFHPHPERVRGLLMERGC